MKRLLKLIIPMAMLLTMTAAAYAYNVVDLPDSMTLSDAMGIFNVDYITKITVSDIEEGSYITLDNNDIYTFYDTVKDMRVYREINPTPYRGVVINIYTEDDTKSYLINSGIPIGLYGKENYICYKLSDVDTEKILYLQSDYWDSGSRSRSETIHRAVSHDFLKLPEAQWSKPFALEAAAKSLLPYEFTSIYGNNISREQFCILLGNMIAVKEGYYSLEDYMQSTSQAYLRNYFEDCDGVDNSVNILYALGIVSGQDETHFDPRGELTREQAATLFAKAAEKYWDLEIETSLTFEDAWLISDWARFYVTWANENGVMTGITAESFVPQGAYTVEQAVATVVRLYNLLN